MNTTYAYTGPVKAVIFDWAGTTVDFGCCAPAAVFVEVFRRRDISVSVAEARGPMGMHKRDHIRVLTQSASVLEQWTNRFGRPPNEDDVSAMFSEFVPLQLEAIRRHADVVPGALEAIAELRRGGTRIGSTTGYNAEMMAVLVPLAAEAGYEPDCVVTVSEVPEGRPAPWMALEAARRLGVYPMAACVKVGDTPVDMGEGRNAGMWAVGVVEHGNEVGLSQPDLLRLPPEERDQRFRVARKRLEDAGAHYAIDSIAGLPQIIGEINNRLGRGERP